MNAEIRKVVEWARENGWTVEDTSNGYTRFYDPDGTYAGYYPATPSNPRRRLADLLGRLGKHGLVWPPPSKKERRSVRRKRGTA